MAMTEEIPLPFLALAVKWHLLDPSRFAPSIGELRQRAGTEVIRSIRAAKGEDPERGKNGQVVQCQPHNVDHWIGVARKAQDLPAIPPPLSVVAELPAGWEERVDGLIEAMARKRDGDA